MLNRKRLALALPLLLLVTMSFKCGGGGAEVDSSFRRAQRSFDDIAASIREMIFLKRSLSTQRQITLDEERGMTEALLKTNTAAKNALMTIRSIKASDSNAKTILTRRYSDLISSVNRLNLEIQSIQNSEARSKFQGLLQSLASSIGLIQGYLEVTAQPCQDLGGGCFICPPDPCKYCRGLQPSCPR